MPDPTQQQQMQPSAQPTEMDSTAQNIPTPVMDSQNGPPQTAFTQAMQNDVQPTSANSTQSQIPQPDQQQAQIDAAKAQRDKAIEFHPAVEAAHVLRKVGETLAGV